MKIGWSRKALVAGAGGMALAALGYRAWNRGVFAGATGPAFAAWGKWHGRRVDGNRAPLRAAVLAASPHNTQPWQFEESAGAVTVYADRARHLGSFDPFRREMHLGLGCAIENFVLAARAVGIAADVQATAGRFAVSPGPERVTAARVALRPSRPSRDPLFDAIPRRRTNRGPYRDQPIAAEQLRELARLAAMPEVRVVFVSDDAARREMGALIVDATRQIVADADMSLDSFRWIRTGRREVMVHGDGITIDTSGVGRLKTAAAKMLPNLSPAAIDRIWLDATRATHTATAAVLGMILVPDRLNMETAITAGRAWQRLHLAATVQGLAAQPLNQPIEMIDRHQMLGRPDEFGSGLAAFSRNGGWEPTFVFRLGYAEREAPHSPRRPIENVITTATLDRAGETNQSVTAGR